MGAEAEALLKDVPRLAGQLGPKAGARLQRSLQQLASCPPPPSHPDPSSGGSVASLEAGVSEAAAAALRRAVRQALKRKPRSGGARVNAPADGSAGAAVAGPCSAGRLALGSRAAAAAAADELAMARLFPAAADSAAEDPAAAFSGDDELMAAAMQLDTPQHMLPGPFSGVLQ